MGCGSSYESFASHRAVNDDSNDEATAYKSHLRRLLRHDWQRLDSINDVFMIVRRRLTVSTPSHNVIHIGNPRTKLFDNLTSGRGFESLDIADDDDAADAKSVDTDTNDNDGINGTDAKSDDNIVDDDSNFAASLIAHTGINLNKYYLIKQFPKNKPQNDALFVKEALFHLNYARSRLYPSFIYQDLIQPHTITSSSDALDVSNDLSRANLSYFDASGSDLKSDESSRSLLGDATQPQSIVINGTSYRIPPAIPPFITVLHDNENHYIISELPKEFNPNSRLLLDAVTRRDAYTERDISSIIKSLLLTMESLHSFNLYHLNLQPRHILCNLPNPSHYTQLNDVLRSHGSVNSALQKPPNTTAPGSRSHSRRVSFALRNDDAATPGASGSDDEKFGSARDFHVALPQMCIVDFSHAVRCEEHDAVALEFLHEIGEIYYNTPEAMQGELVHGWKLSKADLWHVGLLAYTLLVGYNPFSGASQAFAAAQRARGWDQMASGGPTGRGRKRAPGRKRATDKWRDSTYDNIEDEDEDDLVTGALKDRTDRKSVVLQLILKGKFDFGVRDELNGVSHVARDFVRKCLKPDVMKRLDCKQALRHPWVRRWFEYCTYLQPMAMQSVRNLNDFKQATMLHDLLTNDELWDEKVREMFANESEFEKLEYRKKKAEVKRRHNVISKESKQIILRAMMTMHECQLESMMIDKNRKNRRQKDKDKHLLYIGNDANYARYFVPKSEIVLLLTNNGVMVHIADERADLLTKVMDPLKPKSEDPGVQLNRVKTAIEEPPKVEKPKRHRRQRSRSKSKSRTKSMNGLTEPRGPRQKPRSKSRPKPKSNELRRHNRGPSGPSSPNSRWGQLRAEQRTYYRP